jgi:hypothetical protein
MLIDFCVVWQVLISNNPSSNLHLAYFMLSAHYTEQFTVAEVKICKWLQAQRQRAAAGIGGSPLNKKGI